MIRVSDLCANVSGRCEVGKIIKFDIYMNNPGFLVSDEDGYPFKLQAFNSDNLLITKTRFIEPNGKGIYANPKIEGFYLKDMTVKRSANRLGLKVETLKFFA